MRSVINIIPCRTSCLIRASFSPPIMLYIRVSFSPIFQYFVTYACAMELFSSALDSSALNSSTMDSSAVDASAIGVYMCYRTCK